MKSIASVFKYQGLLLTLIALMSLFLATDMLLRFWYLLLCGPLLLIVGLAMDLGGVSAVLKRRTTKFGAGAIVFTIIVAAIIVFANVIAAGYEKSWDGTSAGVNTLSDQTVKILTSVENPIRVTGFIPAGEESEFKKLLERYLQAAPEGMFAWEVVDPDRNPERLQNHNVTQRGAIVVESGGRNNIIMAQTEDALTQSILKVTQSKTGPVCFVAGHGEAGVLDSEEAGAGLLKRLLENENHDVQEIVLAGSIVPKECGCVIVAGPDRALGELEVQALQAWVAAGGAMMFLSEPKVETGLETWMASYGVTFNDDVLVEPQETLFFGSQIGVAPVVSNYPHHEITKDLDQPTIFQMARSIQVNQDAGPQAMATALLQTSDQSWGELNVQKLLDEGIVEKGADDLIGPLVLGAAIEVTTTTPADLAEAKDDDTATSPENKVDSVIQSRIVVVGDSTFARNGMLGQLYNANLVLNSIAWLTGKEEIISIRPNEFAPSSIFLSAQDRAAVFFISVVFIPMLVSMFGIGVIISRNRRSNA